MAKKKTNSKERELVDETGKEIESPHLRSIDFPDRDKLHLRTLIKLTGQMANHHGWCGRLEKGSFDFPKGGKKGGDEI